MWGSHVSMTYESDGIYLTLESFNGTNLIFFSNLNPLKQTHNLQACTSLLQQPTEAIHFENIFKKETQF